MENIGISLGDLQEVINLSFNRDSAGREDLWIPDNPAYSQCGVATRLVNDLFKGAIHRYKLPADWQEIMGYDGHYINCIPNYGLYDPTKAQFPLEFLMNNYSKVN